MYTVEIRDDERNPIEVFKYSEISDAERAAKYGARHYGGSAIITDGGDVVVRDYRYEGNGKVVGYDDLNNPLEKV
jgi:hypothetical protein